MGNEQRETVPRTCRTCKETKPESEFRLRKRADREDYWIRDCVECIRLDSRRHGKSGRGRRARRRWYENGGKEKVARNNVTYRASGKRPPLTPEKSRCKNLFHSAVRRGKIVRGPCTICGTRPSEGHHEDYSKPLEVVWLCRPCHAYAHLT